MFLFLFRSDVDEKDAAPSPERTTRRRGEDELLATLRGRTQQLPTTVVPLAARSMPASPLRAVGSHGGASEASSPTSRGAQLLRLAQQQEDDQNRPRFSVSALQSDEAPKMALLDARRSLFAAPVSPRATKAAASPRRLQSPGRNPSTAGHGARMPAACEELAEEFAAVEVMAALATQRGDARWWGELARSAATISGARPLTIETAQRVAGVWPEAWRWMWEPRDEHQRHQLRMAEGPAAADLEKRLAHFRGALLAWVTAQHAAFLVERGLPPVEPPAVWHPQFAVQWRLGELPARPAPAVFAAPSGATRLGLSQSNTLTQEEAEAVATQEVPADLAHLPAHLVTEARMRQETAEKLFTPTARERLHGQLPPLFEELRSLCVVNRRYKWPFDVLCAKLAASSVGRPGVKEELRVQLEELGKLTQGFCQVFENTHADGGTFVKLSKRGFREALARLTAAIAASSCTEPKKIILA